MRARTTTNIIITITNFNAIGGKIEILFNHNNQIYDT